MNLVEPARFIRWVTLDEVMEELVEEAKAGTWRLEAEHALLETDAKRRLMVRGGRDGISFTWNETLQVLEMDGPDEVIRVIRIDWHTHPRVTGPSDGDLEALRLLSQDESIIIELGGDRDGTRIRPNSR